MMSRAEAQQIDNLLTLLVQEVGMNVVNAVGIARKTISEHTEGMKLPRQLEIARANDRLPFCCHSRPLMDWGGYQLVPPCGCRLVEPSDHFNPAAIQPKKERTAKP